MFSFLIGPISEWVEPLVMIMIPRLAWACPVPKRRTAKTRYKIRDSDFLESCMAAGQIELVRGRKIRALKDAENGGFGKIKAGERPATASNAAQTVPQRPPEQPPHGAARDLCRL